MISFRVALALVILGLLALGEVVGARFKKPIGEINIAEANRASPGVYPPGASLQFLGEDRLALSSVDGSGLPKDGTMPRAFFHFSIDVFALEGGGLKLASQARFETETSDSSMAALPSGRLLVNTGRKIRVLDWDLRNIAESTAEQVCGLSVEPDQTIAYRIFLLPASEAVGVVGFEKPWYWGIGKAFPVIGQTCWFSLGDLRPIAQTKTGVAQGGTARDLLVYTGWFAISPKGQVRLSIPDQQQCNIPANEIEFADFRLLHAEPVSEFNCRKGFITILRGDGAKDIRMPGSKRWAIGPDAWNAPLVIFDGGTQYFPIFGGAPEVTPRVRLINYDSGASINLPAPKGSANGRAFYAISPSGRRIGVLRGSILSVYDVPPEILK